ncbi:MAG TPA: SGNH/GDSL hydrolase family protein, partial [Armatimonadota bacterium]|nr:SGNH/GDSL hydrolase family protein [Armatimonadota bacterium]
MSDIKVARGARIIFQGDSITDAGRCYDDDSQLGLGYPNMIAAWLSARYPSQEFTFINRGVSGNRIYDMESRWTEDCIALQPDLVSILIGINDTWRRYDSDLLSPIAEFEESYRRLLDRLRTETDTQILLLEPFVLPTPQDRERWREDLDPRIGAVRRVARDYHLPLLPLDGLFAAAAAKREPEFWAADGVHPTQAGHALISQA